MNFEKLDKYIDSLPEQTAIPGCDIIVYQDHKQIYRRQAGFRDVENRIKINGKELYWIFSATKVFTCTAALMLLEKGKLSLSDPVSKYLPTYGILSVIEKGRVHAGYNPMTIEHLFTMCGGLNYDLNSPSIMKAKLYSGGKADTLTIVNAIAEEPLIFCPGEHFTYSLCHDVLAAVVETVSGMRFSEFLKLNIFDKLGIKEATFAPTQQQMDRMASEYVYDAQTNRARPYPGGKVNEYRITENYESGGAGLCIGAEDYIRLPDALACGGIGAAGERLLKPETVELMHSDFLKDHRRKEIFERLWKNGYSYGLGVRTLVDEGFSKSPIGEFGWDGAACAYTLMDTKNKLSIYFATHIRSYGYGYEVIHPRLRDLVYEGLEN